MKRITGEDAKNWYGTRSTGGDADHWRGGEAPAGDAEHWRGIQSTGGSKSIFEQEDTGWSGLSITACP